MASTGQEFSRFISFPIVQQILITLITLAGLFIGVYYHDSLVGGGQEDQQQKTETSVSGQ